MSEGGSFIERVLAGEVLDLDTIDDEIDSWHRSSGKSTLADWLGLTEEEYRLFVEKPDALRVILMARRHGQSLQALLTAADNAVSLAARGASTEEVQSIRKWLQQTGRL